MTADKDDVERVLLDALIVSAFVDDSGDDKLDLTGPEPRLSEQDEAALAAIGPNVVAKVLADKGFTDVKERNNMNLRFRKKPVVVEAFQMTRARRMDNIDWPEWLHRAWNLERGAVGSLYPAEMGTADETLVIGTLEGQHLVSWGDWIIRGVKGEIYPCKPDIFMLTYEPIPETQSFWKRLMACARRFWK